MLLCVFKRCSGHFGLSRKAFECSTRCCLRQPKRKFCLLWLPICSPSTWQCRSHVPKCAGGYTCWLPMQNFYFSTRLNWLKSMLSSARLIIYGSHTWGRGRGSKAEVRWARTLLPHVCQGDVTCRMCGRAANPPTCFKVLELTKCSVEDTFPQNV